MQQLNCVSLLLLLGILLAALGPFAATAHRELLMAATGEGGDEVLRSSETAEEGVIRGRRTKGERVSCRFRTRKLPSDVKNMWFDGRVPFTADYHSVQRHPPKHN